MQELTPDMYFCQHFILMAPLCSCWTSFVGIALSR